MPSLRVDAQLRVNLWDLAGGEDYVEVRNEFYKEAQGCVLVYDATNRDSFESLDRWLEESHKYGAENMVRSKGISWDVPEFSDA
jgi:DnaJ family protein C protein 27